MKYYGTYVCGHEGAVQIYGPTKEHERKKNYIFSNLCPECEKLELQKKRDEANQKSMAVAVKLGLPALTGSEKQIAWATTIRNEQMECVNSLVKEREEFRVKISDEILITIDEWKKAFENILETETTSKFWIDNREEYSMKKRINEKCKELY